VKAPYHTSLHLWDTHTDHTPLPYLPLPACPHTLGWAEVPPTYLAGGPAGGPHTCLTPTWEVPYTTHYRRWAPPTYTPTYPT